MKAMNEQMVKTKDEQIAQLSGQIDKFKSLPQPANFRAEALQINKALVTQIGLLCHKIAQVEPLCDITASIIDTSVDDRQDLEQADETLTNFVHWQDTNEGQAANLPKILESHKEILFMEWQSQLMKAERAVSRCKLSTSNLIELINNTLYLSNMISQCTPSVIDIFVPRDMEHEMSIITGILSP